MTTFYYTECDLQGPTHTNFECLFCNETDEHTVRYDCDECCGSGYVTREDDDGDEYEGDCDECNGWGTFNYDHP